MLHRVESSGLEVLKMLTSYGNLEQQARQKALLAQHDAELAQLYEGLALAFERLSTRKRPHLALLQAAATVQSRLAAYLEEQCLPPDELQLILHDWLVVHANTQRVYIREHMRRNSVASAAEAQQAVYFLRALSRAPYEAPSQRKEKDAPKRGDLAPQVLELRRALRGRTLLLISNDGVNVPLLERCAALDIHVRHQPFTHAMSPFALEPLLRQPDLAAVVVTTRWAAHSLKDIKRLCLRYGVAYVQLPAGYGLNTLAFQVLGQVGQKLAA